MAGHRHGANLDKASDTPTALLLIDIQQGFNHPTHWGTSRSTPAFKMNVAKLLEAFRSHKSGSDGPQPLIVHVYHSSALPDSPLHPNSKGIRFMPYVEPREGEVVLSKNVNSAFIGTDLEAVVRNRKIRQLLICGLTTDHCVSTTARMAANLGVVDVRRPDGSTDVGKVIVVEDAVATFAKGKFDARTVHEVNIASLQGEFAEVMTAEEIQSALFD